MSNLLTSKEQDTAKTGTNMSTLLTEIIEICKDGATATRTAEQFAEMYSHRNSVFTYKGRAVVDVDIAEGFSFDVVEKQEDKSVLQTYSITGTTIEKGTTTALGGESLPEVSATDNGDVLGVVEGEWAKTELPTPTRLPSAFQEVEYIESTGTQYIDTGVNSYRTALGLDLQFTDNTFGSNGSADSGVLQITGNSADNHYLGFRNEGNEWESTITCTDRNLVVFDAYKGTIYHNGSLIHTMTGASTSGSATLYLFARYSTQWGNSYCKEKLYGAKVFSYLGTTVDKCLVRHYIPCYRIADNEIGMYDIVNDVFYTNAGTGTFGKGADV